MSEKVQDIKKPSEVSLRDWFGLRRDHYILDPRIIVEDRAFYARRPHSMQIESLVSGLEVDLEAKLCPKKLYWGVIGGGKTHTLYKTLEELGSRLQIHVVFVECPVTKKALTFTELYRKVLNEMGIDLVINDILKNEVSDIVQKIGIFETGKAERELINVMGDEDLGRAAYTILTAGTEFKPLVMWRWLKADEISSSERDSLRVTGELKSDPELLANILILLGRLMLKRKGKTLVMVFDELDRVKEASLDAKETFKAAFTRLTEPAQFNVSTFLSASADSVEDVPDLLSEAVLDRLKGDIREIPAMTSEDVMPFVKDLIAYVRDPKSEIKSLAKKAKEDTEEKVTEDLFPFTEEAIEAVKTSCGDKITPRAITKAMSKGVGLAKVRRKRIVTSKEVEIVG
jgi:hypothetical protein